MNRCNIPEIWPEKGLDTADWQSRREEIVRLLCGEEYGFLPPTPAALTWDVIETDEDFCAGKAPLRKILLRAELENGNSFAFPVSVTIPNAGRPVPFFVHISFSADVPDRYMPSEEIIDSGFGVLSFCYEDVCADNGDFLSGLAGALELDGNAACGKIALWAWAAVRVMDYAATLPELDKSRAAVVGHSRLGKTALLAGAVDTRFSFVISNESGCCGAAVSRGKKGETIRNITDAFPYWFRDGFRQYAEKEPPFDQHFLLAAAAPRYVYVASAAGDEWAGPEHEFLSCVLAGKVWEALGLEGFVCKGERPVTGEPCHNGHIGYHIRDGAHYLSREDWRQFMRFISRK
ncbi:MAG: hypothetical protein FWH16_01290 [Oscillospiraceae bacterium]|nr:hypothetical protein [Oscillospiraceae bacterium]